MISKFWRQYGVTLLTWRVGRLCLYALVHWRFPSVLLVRMVLWGIAVYWRRADLQHGLPWGNEIVSTEYVWVAIGVSGGALIWTLFPYDQRDVACVVAIGCARAIWTVGWLLQHQTCVHIEKSTWWWLRVFLWMGALMSLFFG